MNARPFGATGLAVSAIGLGTWQLGSGWGKILTEDQARAVLAAASENGVTFYDTADVYGDGLSEQRLAKYLKDLPGQRLIATKIGRWRNPGWPGNFSRAVFRAQAEASISRLGVERLDILQSHTLPREVLARGEIFEWMRELAGEGKVRFFGASVESVDEALLCLDVPGIACLQIICSVLRQEPVFELFAKAREKGVALIARSPLASGLLAGRIKAATTFAGSDHRNFNKDGRHFNPGETFAGLPQEQGVALIRELNALRPKRQSLAQTALRFVLDFPEIAVVIPGAKTPAQVAENAAAAALPPLSRELHAQLADFYRCQVKPLIRGKI